MVDGTVDWGADGRVDRWRIVRVDPFSLQELGEVDFVGDECSVEWASGDGVGLSASIRYVDWEDVGSDSMLRVKHTVEVGGRSFSEDVATLFVEDAGGEAIYRLDRASAKCYGPLARYTVDRLVSDFARDAGTGTIDAIRYLVESRGGKLAVGDGVASIEKQTFGGPIWFELKSPLIDVLRVIAGWIGCTVGFDGYGNVTLDMDVPADERPVSYVFEAGRNCTYRPGVKVSTNKADVKNRCLVFYSSDEAHSRGMYDLPDGYRGSFARTGRIKPDIVKLSEYASDAECEAYARERLLSQAGIWKSYTVEHVQLPGLHVGDVVRFESDADFSRPVSDVCVVTQIALGGLGKAPMCTTELLSLAVIEEA